MIVFEPHVFGKPQLTQLLTESTSTHVK